MTPPLALAADTAVLVARFQTYDLHDGHAELLGTVVKGYRKVLVVLGEPSLRSARNPLDFVTRERMIKQAFPMATVLMLRDEALDTVWSRKLDALVEQFDPHGSVVMLGGPDSFVAHYTGRFPTVELTSAVGPRGTDYRHTAATEPVPSADFRRGVIYGLTNIYGRVNLTVDVALFQDVVGETKAGESWTDAPRIDRKLLLVRKPDETAWRLPGGFVRPNEDPALAAARELEEETGVAAASLTLQGAHVVDDWRGADDQGFLTLLYTGRAPEGATPRGMDDVAEARYFFVDRLPEIVLEHVVLLDSVSAFLSNPTRRA